MRNRTGRTFAAVAALGACAVLANGCRRAIRSDPSAPVILISVDTLRADHLPAYGYGGVETPNLDRLRKDSILFSNAYSHVPLTLPSHVSLMTGLLPPQNGVRDNIGYTLGPAPETLAGYLKKAGYSTGAAVSSFVLVHTTGIARGFDFYDDEVEPTSATQSIGRVQRDGATTEARLRSWIEKTPGTKVFAFLHLFEPHTPYDPPEPYKSRYAAHPYDGEIARADEIVGSFLRFLEERGLYDKAALIFLSDHGEGLGDHGEQEHGVLLYREAIHVPLLLKLPRADRAGETIDTPVALTDVFPSIVALLGSTAPPALPGLPLTAHLPGRSPGSRRLFSETLYPRLHLGWSDLASLVDATYQYIEAPRPELYDLAADPGEKKDLSAGLPPAFRSMRLELSRLPRPLRPPGSSDPERIKKLAALGYVSASSSDTTTGDLPDPKDRVADVERLKVGFGHLQSGRYAEAATIFRQLVAENPTMTDVWEMLAQAELKLGADAKALQALQRAASLSPGNSQILLALADFYLETGQYELARKHAALAGEAGAADAYENLARIAAAQGDWPTAEKQAQAALAEHPGRRIPRLILARVLKSRGDLAGALSQLEMARKPSDQINPAPLYNMSFLRGDILARAGRTAEAEAAFRDEIRDFPSSTPAWTALALLYASEGRQEESRAALEALARLRTPDSLFAAARTYEILGDRESSARLRRLARQAFPAAQERPRASG